MLFLRSTAAVTPWSFGNAVSMLELVLLALLQVIFLQPAELDSSRLQETATAQNLPGVLLHGQARHWLALLEIVNPSATHCWLPQDYVKHLALKPPTTSCRESHPQVDNCCRPSLRPSALHASDCSTQRADRECPQHQTLQAATLELLQAEHLVTSLVS